jgi:hypothetical protein
VNDFVNCKSQGTYYMARSAHLNAYAFFVCLLATGDRSKFAIQ